MPHDLCAAFLLALMFGCKPFKASRGACETIAGANRERLQEATGGTLSISYHVDAMLKDYGVDASFKELLRKTSGVVTCTGLLAKNGDSYELWTAKHCLKPQGIKEIQISISQKTGTRKVKLESKLLDSWVSLYQGKLSDYISGPILPPKEKHHDPVQLSAFFKARENKLGKKHSLTAEEEEAMADFQSDQSLFGGSLCYGQGFKFVSSPANKACFLNQDLIMIDIKPSRELVALESADVASKDLQVSDFERQWRESFELRENIAIKYALFNASLRALDACGKVVSCNKNEVLQDIFSKPLLTPYRAEIVAALARIDSQKAKASGLVSVNPYVGQYLQVSRNISRLWSRVRKEVKSAKDLELTGVFQFDSKKEFGRINLEKEVSQKSFALLLRGYGLVLTGGELIFGQGDSGSLLSIRGGLPIAAMSRLNNLDTSGGASTAGNLPALPEGVSTIDIAGSDANFTVDINDASLSQIEGKSWPAKNISPILQGLATSQEPQKSEISNENSKISKKPREISPDEINSYLEMGKGGC